MSDIQVERSRLCNTYQTKIKELEKEMKKKKNIKNELAEKIEELEAEQLKALAEFDATHGLVTKATKAVEKKVKEEKQKKEKVKKPKAKVEEEDSDLEDRNWNSLSKGELEEACESRGLSKKGKKEDLISRLTVFTLTKNADNDESSSSDDEKPKAKAASKAPVNKIKVEYVGESQTASGNKVDRSRKKIDHRKTDKKEIDSEDEEKELLKRNKHLLKKNNESENEEENEEKIKQKKREEALQPVLTKLLTKFESIKISEFSNVLAKAKVQNFTPQLLGYETVEEYLSKQPKNILHFDKKKQTIWNPNVLPTYSSDEESD